MKGTRLFFQSLWIQALLSYSRMQGSGFAKLSETFGSPRYFNTHPWFAAAFARMLDREVRKGRDPNDLRLAWMGTLGALGDGLFWSFLRPLFVIFAMVALASDFIPLWMVPLLFFVFSIVARIALQIIGAGGEEAMLKALSRYKLRELIARGREITYLVVSFAAGGAWSFILTQDLYNDRLPTSSWSVVIGLSVALSLLFAIVTRTLPIRAMMLAGSVMIAGYIWMLL